MARIRFSVALPTYLASKSSDLTSAAAIMEMSSAVEEAGFGACYVTDHPFPPADWVACGGHHSLDPFVALSFAAAATGELALHTNCVIPAYRNPFILAKSAATLDALSGGRVILGVAAGYLEPEFAALGAVFEGRGERLEQSIELVKLAWMGTPVHASGPGWDADGSVMLPAPVSEPHPPIWVGGNSRAAMRRAAALAQGWMPFPASPGTARALRTASIRDLGDLAARLERLRELRDALGGGERFDVCATPFSHAWGSETIDLDALLDESFRMAEIGVTWLAVTLPARDRVSFLRCVEAFGSRVVPGASEA